MVHVILLSAPIGSGKTTACRRCVQLAKDAELRVGGILSLARYDAQGQKIGIDAEDVLTGERRELAHIEADARLATVGRYRFEPAALEWATQRVLQALAAPIDAVLIDEIGPLELVKQGGLAPALEALAEAQAAAVVLVVRSELLMRLQDRLSALAPLTVGLTLANRNQIPARLLEEIWAAQSIR